MFLVTVTTNPLGNRFRPAPVEEIKIGSFTATIVMDNFTSKCISEPDGFSIVESPLMSSPNFTNIVLSRVRYSKNRGVLDIFRSTMSGRPIYYHMNSKGEFYCSTHIHMLRKVGVPIEENKQVVPEFFVYRYVMPPQTLYRNIRQLVAGSELHVKLVNGKCKIDNINQYSPPVPSKKESDGTDTIAERVAAILNESIRSLNPCKDKLSVLLSGGLDSSILFKTCQANYEINKTYSTGYPFEHPRRNLEKEYAFSAAKSFNVKHTYYQTSPEEYLKGFIEAIESAEVPIHHLQSVLFHLILKNGIPADKQIIISGEGAEGPFGWPGVHDRIYNCENNAFYKLLMMYPLRKSVGLVSRITGRMKTYYAVMEHFTSNRDLPLENPDSIIWSVAAYGDEKWVKEYFGVRKDDIIKGRYEAIRRFHGRCIYDLLSILCLYGEDTVTQSIWGKIGERHGRILYYPYTDRDLLDYAYSITWNSKLRKPKDVLRAVARQLGIPEFIITRRKIGFGIEPKRWAGKGGIFEPLIPLASKVFDEKRIRDMQSFEPKKAMTFWSILNFSIWKRLHINNEPLSVLLEELQESIVANKSLQ